MPIGVTGQGVFFCTKLFVFPYCLLLGSAWGRKRAREGFKKLLGGGTLHSDRIWAHDEP